MDERFERYFSRYSNKKIERFLKFDKENPDIYREFTWLAYQMKNSGRTKYSAETIINVLRWDKDVKTNGGEEFKISNDFRSMYARYFVYHNPAFENFFDMKGINS